MCGIAGFLSSSPNASGDRLAAAGRRLQHRGPDDSAFLAASLTSFSISREPPQLPSHLGFVHRRLSILDLSERGRQPMASPSNRSAICFNGEIYNYRELRTELESLGSTFHTESDTEVLLAMLDRFGRAALPRLRGMFAFAYLNLDSRSLLLARDPFGIKPLYLLRHQSQLAFASETAALLDLLPDAPTSLDPQHVYNFLRFGTADNGRSSLYHEISQLPPAHSLEIPLDNPAVGTPVPYWSVQLNEPRQISLKEAAAGLRDRFIDSVRLHLRSDVPVGAALSGGVDSSAIVASMRALEPHADIHAFCYAPAGFSLNEERWARIAADKAGVHLHTVDFSASELASDLDQLLLTQGEPFGSTSIYAQYRIFKAARAAGVPVMLDGQGGDETLAGYPLYFAARLAGMARRHEWSQLLNLWRKRATSGGGHMSAWYQAAGHLLPESLANAGRRLVGKELMPAWLQQSYFQDARVRTGRLESPLNSSGVRGVLAETLTRTIIPQLLHFEDRNSMAWSVESRVPFLHVEFVEYALSLPEHLLLGDDGTTKLAFREAMRGLVPDPILDRRDKIGFHTPQNTQLAETTPWVRSILDSIPESASRIINPDGLLSLWNRVSSGQAGHDHSFWRALCFIRWLQLHPAVSP
jgi:asparagine synthase (glutamine-hydrolysing)